MQLPRGLNHYFCALKSDNSSNSKSFFTTYELLETLHIRKKGDFEMQIFRNWQILSDPFPCLDRNKVSSNIVAIAIVK